MVLNYECVRDVLLYLEAQDYFIPTDSGVVEYCPVCIEQICSDLPDYGESDVFYTLFNLGQAGYIDTTMLDSDNGIMDIRVNYITFQGHEFLSKIKDNGHWSSVKKGLSVVRDCSLSAIGAIAQGITGALIDSYIKAKR
ncbi:MAG: DUF2513 domain-containing protein [Firmicutes bacterium]|nr:DUF2513 domain-containing protein [Bacillota bacterium]